jgi:hypothetical protein
MAQQTIISTEYGDTSLTKINANFTDLYTTKKSDSMTTNKLLGRNTAGTGVIEEITLGTNLSMTGTTLNASGGGGITIGTTAITSGVSGRILYDNAGVVGELATNGTGNVSLTTSPTFVTPILGVATATSINGATITSGTLNGGTNTGDETTARINTLYGTTNAITVGSVEVGNATDTTISRVSAGTIAFEGITISSTLYPTADTDGATVTFNLSANNKHTVTIAGNRTLALSNTTNVPVFSINIKQDATGSRTVTWFSGITWAGGTVPTLTTTANKTDSFGFQQISAGVYLGCVIFQNA